MIRIHENACEHWFALDAKKMTPTRTDHQVFLLPEIRVQIIKILHATRSDSPFKTERVGVVKFCVQRETIEREWSVRVPNNNLILLPEILK